VNQLSRDLTEIGLRVMLLTGLEDIDIERLRVQQLDRRAVLYLEPRIRTGWRRLAKRTFDLAFASLCLVISLPVIALAALAIRLESPGPVFFRQDRIGLDGRRFKMTKLRTMVCDAEERRGELLELNEADGPLFKIREDPRITRVGRFLRKSSIDEIPQFWNVLRGDMSVVGPRPALPNEVERWSPDLHDRLRVLPGITGLWQVSGRSDADFENYRRLDLYYVHNWSLAHDVRIVAKTVLVVFNGRGAS
jgi:exopolysaccharide biosynthesis polyprenyl glycosylphosphotransferase